MEVKFGQELNEKQLQLFEKFSAKEKIILSGWQDFLNLK